MDYNVVRIRLPEEIMKKYKVYCAIENMSMTAQTGHLIREFVKMKNENIKIINVNKE